MNFEKFWQELVTVLNNTLHLLIGAPDAEDIAINWSEVATTASVKFIIVSVVVLLFFIIYKLVCTYVTKFIKRFNYSTKTQDIVLEGCRYVWWFASSLVILLQIGVSREFIISFSRAVFIGAFFLFLWKFLKPLVNKIDSKYRLNSSLKQLLYNVSLVLIVIFAFGSLMAQFGFDLVSIVAGLGIIGMAVGFAAQSTLADFIAGVTILLERPFNIGDWVSVGDHTGKVEKIALRTTHIKTRANVSVILPNNSIASAEIINLSARRLSAYEANFGIAYEEDVAKTRGFILDHIKENITLVLKTPAPVIRVDELGDSSVNLTLFYWLSVDNLDQQVVINAQLLEDIKSVLNRENIEIPYPHVQLMQNK